MTPLSGAREASGERPPLTAQAKREPWGACEDPALGGASEARAVRNRDSALRRREQREWRRAGRPAEPPATERSEGSWR